MALLAPWPELEKYVDRVLEVAAGRPGHIFNVGRLADYVHEETQVLVPQETSYRCSMLVPFIDWVDDDPPVGVEICARNANYWTRINAENAEITKTTAFIRVRLCPNLKVFAS